MPNEPDTSRTAVRSQFADDPEMSELVALFVTDLPERVAALMAAWDDRDAVALARLTHQMKGAAPGYGFDILGEAAGRIEHRLRDADDPGVILDEIKRDVDELVNLCRRAILPEAA